jgi:hypothetical protein
MDELERRLSSALTEMAEEVSPSHHAWVEQERRLALKSRRARVRPALMAAVAAAVVALIAVPVMVLNLRSAPPVEHGSLPTSDPSTPGTSGPSGGRSTFANPGDYQYRSVAGETLVTQPAWLDSTKDGSRSVVGYTIARNGVSQVCYAVVPYAGTVNGPDQQVPPVCSVVKPAKGMRWAQVPVNADTESQGVYIYVTNSQVKTILLRRGEDDGYRQAEIIGQTPEFAVLAVRMGSPIPPKAATAKDSAEKALESW